MKLITLYEKSKRETIALVPGSFRPPTKAHFYMIQQYSRIADKVIVILSKPSPKSERLTNIGTKISVKDSLAIFKIYANVYGLNNVKFIESDDPSPIKFSYDYAENKLKDVNVIFGASKKGGDFKRWGTVTKYMDENNPSITVLDPEKYAVEPLASGGKSISASDWRNQIDNMEIYKDFVPDKVANNQQTLSKLFKLLNK